MQGFDCRKVYRTAISERRLNRRIFQDVLLVIVLELSFVEDNHAIYPATPAGGIGLRGQYAINGIDFAQGFDCRKVYRTAISERRLNRRIFQDVLLVIVRS